MPGGKQLCRGLSSARSQAAGRDLSARSWRNSEQPKSLWPHPAALLKGSHECGVPLVCPSCTLPAPGRWWDHLGQPQQHPWVLQGEARAGLSSGGRSSPSCHRSAGPGPSHRLCHGAWHSTHLQGGLVEDGVSPRTSESWETRPGGLSMGNAVVGRCRSVVMPWQGSAQVPETGREKHFLHAHDCVTGFFWA